MKYNQVTFIEAIKEFKNGKKIKVQYGMEECFFNPKINICLVDSGGVPISAYEILYGIWFVLEK